ncbi:Cytoplasmic dynein 2 light intermediate chain 1 [Durusdinium trenchii]|uniref:Cytoplasmic dynein 2 light intermediate chain 1 n=1 Tax=Durusdinium trenchii TaxID=1381693 RepID=A0ABP0QCR3_9DINO
MSCRGAAIRAESARGRLMVGCVALWAFYRAAVCPSFVGPAASRAPRGAPRGALQAVGNAGDAEETRLEHLSNFLWASAHLKRKVPAVTEIVPDLVEVMRNNTSQMNPQNLSNSLWALGELAGGLGNIFCLGNDCFIDDSDLVDSDLFDAHKIDLCGHWLTCRGAAEPDAVVALVEQIQGNVDEMSLQQLSDCLWASLQLQDVTPDVMKILPALGSEACEAVVPLKMAEKKGQNARAGVIASGNRGSGESAPSQILQWRGAKWDVLASDVDPEKRKNLCRAPLGPSRSDIVAELHPLSQKSQEKTSMNAMRGLLRQLLFCVPPKGPGPEKQDKPERLRPVPTTMPEETLEQSSLEQLDHSKPICVTAGKDIGWRVGPESPAAGDVWPLVLLETVQKSLETPQRLVEDGSKRQRASLEGICPAPLSGALELKNTRRLEPALKGGGKKSEAEQAEVKCHGKESDFEKSWHTAKLRDELFTVQTTALRCEELFSGEAVLTEDPMTGELGPIAGIEGEDTQNANIRGQALKAQVAQLTGLPVEHQRLLDVSGRELQRSLEEVSSDELTLLRRPEEQAKWLAQLAEAGSSGDLSKAPDEIREDREVLLAAVSADDDALQWASTDLQGDRAVVLAAVRRCGFALACAAGTLQADRSLVLAAVQRHGLALEFADTWLRADEEVVLTALEQDGNAFQFADVRLRSDRTFVLRAVRCNGYALTYAQPELRNDREIVMAAIERNGWIWDNGLRVSQFGGWALQCASEALQADRELVLAAVQQDGAALAFASEELREEKEVVLQAVHQTGSALAFAAPALKADREVVWAAVQESGLALEHAADELRDDEDLVFVAVATGAALRFASPRLRAQRRMVCQALRADEAALAWASEELQSDRKLQKFARRCGQVERNSRSRSRKRADLWEEGGGRAVQVSREQHRWDGGAEAELDADGVYTKLYDEYGKLPCGWF